MAQELPDLKQVSALFNDCIEMIRSRPLDNLDAVAEEWIKATRFKVMKEIEKHYYELASVADDPLKAPQWAVEPSQPLELYTQRHSRLMDQYSIAFKSNLNELMRECGFCATITTIPATFYSIKITFPARIAPKSTSRGSGRTANAFQQLSSSISRIGTRAITAGPMGRNAPIITEPEDDGSGPSGGIGQRLRGNRRTTRRAIEAPPKPEPASSATDSGNGSSGSIAERVRGKRRMFKAESPPTDSIDGHSEGVGQHRGGRIRVSRRGRVSGNAGITKRKRQ